MALEILSAKKFSVQLKATIHSTGKLGFTEATAGVLKLTASSGVKFAEDKEKGMLYLINCHDCDEDCFKVTCAGDYYSVNTKTLFDSLGFDYKARRIMFDMVREESEDMEIYKLLTRENRRKQKD